MRNKLRSRIATRGDVVTLQSDLRKLQRRVDGLPDLKEHGRELRRLAKQISAQDGAITKQSGQLTKQAATLKNQGSTQTQHASALTQQVADVKALQHQLRVLAMDYERMAQQLAATETRLERLREQLDPETFGGSSDEHLEARSLVEEIRREHDQIRVRFQVVSNYEERLSRVETVLLRASQPPAS